MNKNKQKHLPFLTNTFALCFSNNVTTCAKGPVTLGRPPVIFHPS